MAAEAKLPRWLRTPVVWKTPVGKQVAAAGHYKLIGYDLNSGEEKWCVKGMPTASCASQ